MTRKLPQRRHLDDPLLTPDGHEQKFGITIDHMLAPLDRLAGDMARKWGTVDRLVELWPMEPPAHVPVERHDEWRSTPRRYGELCETLARAQAEGDADTVQETVPRVMKAMKVMDAQLRRAGVEPPEPLVALLDVDGRRIGIMREAGDWKKAEKDYPGVELFSAREAAVALVRMKEGTALLGEVKRRFPDAELADVRPARAVAEDPIPFG